MTDSELLSAIKAAEASSYSPTHGELASDRADAIDRYLGKEYGNEVAGRSRVVSRDVADVVEGVLANVIKPFIAGDQVVQFTPRGPEDEEAAQQETDYINFVALERNNGFVVLATAFKDALLLRNGYVKCGWTKREDVLVEEYRGQSDDQIAVLLSDNEVEVIGHAEYPDPYAPPMQPGMPMAPMLHDVKIRRKNATEYVETIPVPPEEMIISERTRTPCLQDADFVQHRTHKTLSELRQLGYEVDDDVSDDDEGGDQEDYARTRWGDNDDDDETNDPSRRVVQFKESWLRIDKDGDGVAELRRVCSIGSTLLSDDEADMIPIAAFTGTLFAHRHHGVSLYDQVKDLAQLKTALLRQYMDNKYLANNARSVVDVDRVNLDDLLESRPGGIVRANGDPSSAVMPLVTPDTGASALQALEYLDTTRENRTGYTRYAQGMGSDSLVNKTATGLMQATNQSQMRLEMVSRTIAETGVRDLFRIVHALTLKHATKSEKVRLRGKWVVVNPREWVKRMDLEISVGLGSGNSEQMFGKLMTMVPLMQQAQAAGLAGPKEFYNLGVELWKAAGFKNPDKFLHSPPVGPDGQPIPPQAKPDPMVLAAQEQSKGLAQKAQIDGQTTLQKAQIDAAATMHKIDSDAKTRLQETYIEQASKMMIEAAKANIEERKVALDAQQQQAEQQLAALQGAAERVAGLEFGPLLDRLEHIARLTSAERELVRDPKTGRAIGARLKGLQ